ncbi:alpha/beta fold hydrolase [Leptolyngbya sp. NK1-12]|uniref:Alpha/beta fold hydrolase n=1 Tax=Leptolyngbya sp. NK1-12 TaxID=2547451 RepID=A0AA96WF13_9CYAN|nr:alpha/beta fold hydrolase [Leptolyngbya sp. NK1-12]
MAIKENSITINELEWFYREAEPLNPSAKPPVLLLHGLPSQSYGWRNVMPALAEQGFRSIAPDWIGFGFSGKPDKRSFAYTSDAYVQALADFLQALEIPRLFLVVQGFLGSVGLQYALRHPDAIERLAILNAPITTAAKLPWKMKQLGLPLVGEMLTQDPLLVDRTLEGGGGYRVEDADLDVYRRPFLKSSAAGRSLFTVVQKLKLAQATAEIEAGFANWQQPTLVAWGMRDPWLPFSIAEAFSKIVPQAELAQLEEVGHYPQEDWHEKVNAVLLNFLRRQLL